MQIFYYDHYTFPLPDNHRFPAQKYALLRQAVQQANFVSNEQLAEAKEKAEVANRAKSTFLANMSHELRTPLNAILGFAQLMAQDTALETTYRENMRLIQRSGEHLLELINDILDMSKIEAGRVTLIEKDFDLFAMLHNIEEMMQLRAQKKEIDFYIDVGKDVPTYIYADERKLRQVLINLLSNAFKFTDEGNIRLHIRKETDFLLYFTVEDTGVGISPGEMDRLFEAFVQTASVLEQDLAGVRDVGCDAVLRKPFQTDEIFEQMKAFLSLEYMYEDMTPSNQPKTSRVTEPVSLPKDWLLALKEATELLDTRLMLKLVSSIDKSNPMLATTLKTWIHDFDYERVLKFLEKAS